MKNFSFVFFKAMLIARTNLQGSLRRGIGSVLFLNLYKPQIQTQKCLWNYSSTFQ